MNFFKAAVLGLGISMAAPAVAAHDWALDTAASSLAFGSIKKDTIGETHHIAFASGTVEHGGAAVIALDLTSVDTGIDVRNARILKYVFGNKTEASVTADIGMDTVEALGIGETVPLNLSATLHFLGKDIGVSGPVIAVRLPESRAMVVSDGMMWFDTKELGVDAGIDKLQELASLPSITHAIPVTFRLFFDMHM